MQPRCSFCSLGSVSVNRPLQVVQALSCETMMKQRDQQGQRNRIRTCGFVSISIEETCDLLCYVARGIDENNLQSWTLILSHSETGFYGN